MKNKDEQDIAMSPGISGRTTRINISMFFTLKGAEVYEIHLTLSCNLFLST